MADLNYLLSKVGNISAATRAKAIEIINAAEAAGHEVRFVWGMGGGIEHGSGNALDLMVYNHDAGEWIYNYVWNNRQRLRLRHVIWAQTITSTTTSPGVRRRMADRGSVTENHYDHNHIWFLDAADYVPPAVDGGKSLSDVASEVIRGLWGNGDDRRSRLSAAGYDYASVQAEVNRQLGKAPTPPPPPAPVKRELSYIPDRRMTGPDVERLQAGLRRVFPAYAGRLKVDGDFGANTHKAVVEFQRRSGLDDDGIVGPDTRAELAKYDINV